MLLPSEYLLEVPFSEPPGSENPLFLCKIGGFEKGLAGGVGDKQTPKKTLTAVIVL